MVHSVSEPDSAFREGKRAKYRKAQYLINPYCVFEDAIIHRELALTGEAL